MMRTPCTAERVDAGSARKDGEEEANRPRPRRQVEGDVEREAKRPRQNNPMWEESRRGTRTTITRAALARYVETEEKLRLCQEDLERARFRVNDLEAARARRLLLLRKMPRPAEPRHDPAPEREGLRRCE